MTRTEAGPTHLDIAAPPITADNPQVQAFAQMGPLSAALLKAAEQMAQWAIEFSKLARALSEAVEAAKAMVEAAEEPSRQ